MTRPVTEIMICPNCRAKGEFTVYTSINATYNPELAKKMESGELFIWECPKCKKKYSVRYDYIYHDMKKGLIELR